MDKGRVLIVDDEKLIRDSLSRYLRAEGFEVVTAENGRQALELLNLRWVPVVVTDIMMPEMDGLELLQHIKRDYPKTEVIILSGHGQMQHAIDALRHEAYDYLQKPIDFDELLIVLERAFQKRDAERRYREMQERLYHAQKMDALGTLAGGVAHEFNNLMGGILGYCDMALKQGNPELTRKALEVSVKAATRAATIARNLLRFARRESGHAVNIDLNQVIRDTLSLLEKDLAKDQIQVECRLDNLPLLRFNEAQLQQVVLNLLVNARRAILSRDSRPGRIHVATTFADNRLSLRISDNGPGIASDQRRQVFEPFYTTWGLLGGGESATATGLGLSVVDGIVRGSGGEITIEDTPGGGATFIVNLPGQPDAQARRPRILVCDDESGVRRIMHLVLERSGFEVDEARDGREALLHVEEKDYSVVFLDQLMPDMDGLTVLKELALNRPEIPVVMITAVANHQLAREAILAGGRECVPKPVNNDKLVFLARKYAELAPTAEEDALRPPPDVPRESKHVLVIDANPVIRDIYNLVLARAGFRVTTLDTGAEAVERTRDSYFDLIIADTADQDMSEVAMIKAIRANNPYTPILLSTGNLTEEKKRSGLRAGASCVILKPVDPSSLIDSVLRLIGMYHETE